MAKYSGRIGYTSIVETEPGLYEEKISYTKCCGSVLSKRLSDVSINEINHELQMRNRLSIIAKDSMFNGVQNIACAEYAGTFWTVTDAEIVYPRIILTLGGIYHE